MSLPQLQHLPKFLEFSPGDEEFTCIFPLSRAQFRRCQKPVSKKDRQSAILLRDEIRALDPCDDAVDAYLQSYAQLCCCTRYHRAEIIDPLLLKQLSCQWKKQFRPAAIVHSREADRLAATDANHLNFGVENEVDDIGNPRCQDATFKKASQRAPQDANLGFLGHVPIVDTIFTPTHRDLRKSSPDEVHGKDTCRRPRIGRRQITTPTSNLGQSQPTPTPPAAFSIRSITTRSQTGSLAWSFTPRPAPAEKSMLKTLVDPISKYSSATGSIYLYERASDPGKIKLGCTTQPTRTRLGQWEKSCGYEPILLYAWQSVPNVRRLESLLKKDLNLQGHGRQETFCKHNKYCTKKHTEWFESSLEDAVHLVDTWVTWMCDALPYRRIEKAECKKNVPVAVLRDEWHRHFVSLSQRDVRIRSSCLQLLPVRTRENPRPSTRSQETYFHESAGEDVVAESGPEDAGAETKAPMMSGPPLQANTNIPRNKASPVPVRSPGKREVDVKNLDPEMAAAFVLAASALCRTFGVDKAAMPALLSAGSLATDDSLPVPRVGGTGATLSSSICSPDLVTGRKPLSPLMVC